MRSYNGGCYKYRMRICHATTRRQRPKIYVVLAPLHIVSHGPQLQVVFRLFKAHPLMLPSCSTIFVSADFSSHFGLSVPFMRLLNIFPITDGYIHVSKTSTLGGLSNTSALWSLIPSANFLLPTPCASLAPTCSL